MNVTITFRHMEPSEAIKEYARSKVAKLQKHLRQPMTARVTLSLEKLEHAAEVQIASGSRRVEAKEVSDDTYASIDAVLDKLDRQISGAKGATQAKRRRRGESVRNGRNPEVAEPVAMTAGEST